MVAIVTITTTYFWFPYAYNPLNPSKIDAPTELYEYILTNIFIKYQLWSLYSDKHQVFPNHLKYFYCSEILIIPFIRFIFVNWNPKIYSNFPIGKFQVHAVMAIHHYFLWWLKSYKETWNILRGTCTVSMLSIP